MTQTPITIAILATTLFFSWQAFGNPSLLSKFMFRPSLMSHNMRREWYRFFTSGLIHADWWHLAFNMVTLYSVGSALEGFFMATQGYLFGMGLFAFFYISALLFSNLPAYQKYRDAYHYAALGASGAVSAILFAFIFLAPMTKIIFFVIPMPSIVFAVVYVAMSIFMMRRQADNIGHEAHLSGALYGVVFMLLLDRLAFEGELWRNFLIQLNLF